MEVVLVMFREGGERRSFSIVREMTVVGRRPDCDLRIPLSEVSRKHCRIIKDGDTVTLEDLGSSNGTLHNGKRIVESLLAPGDTIQVGPVAFVVQINGAPADDQIQPPVIVAEAESDDSGPSTDELSGLAPGGGQDLIGFAPEESSHGQKI
jgi:pSer/pThr/pTyr-binding forkhead associated (FHA) protein